MVLIFLQVTGLTPNVRYYLVIQAATTSGLGSSSEMVELLIPYARPKTNIKPASSATPPEANDPFLGENKSLIILNLPCVNVFY